MFPLAQAEGDLYKTALYDLHIQLGGKVRVRLRYLARPRVIVPSRWTVQLPPGPSLSYLNPA